MQLIRFHNVLIFCAALLPLTAPPARAQFDSPTDSFAETVKKVSDKSASQPARAPQSAPSANAKFEEKYLDVLRKALDVGDEEDPNFWAHAYEIVFGTRATDEKAATLAKQIFTSSNRPALPYVPITKENPAYIPGPEGDKLEAALQAAFDVLASKAKPTPEEYLSVIRAMAPFLRTIAAAEYEKNGGFVIPSGSKFIYESKPYCLQHNLGAPGGGEGMWLIPARTLIPAGAREISDALLVWSEGHQQDQGTIQSLIWAIREANEHPYTNLTPDQKRVLDSALKDGSKRFLEFMGVNTSPAATGRTLSASSGESDSPFGRADEDPFAEKLPAEISATKRAIAKNSKANAGIVEHGLDPRDPRQTEAILRELTNATARTKQTGASPVEGYSLLAPGIAAKTTTSGLGGKIRTEIVNVSGQAYKFRPQDYVGLTHQQRQPFAFTCPDNPNLVDWVAAEKKAREIVSKSNMALQRRYDPSYHAENPLWDILQHDSSGQLICTISDEFNPATWAEPDASRKGTVRSMLLKVTLRGRDGTPIEALWNVFEAIEYDTDCHGFSLTGGQYFINDGDMQSFLNNQKGLLQRVETPDPGDLVVLRNPAYKGYLRSIGYNIPLGEDVVHSVIWMGENRIREAAGVMVYDSGLSGVSLNDALVRQGQDGEFHGHAGAVPVGAPTKIHDSTLEKAMGAFTLPSRPPVPPTVEFWRPSRRP